MWLAIITLAIITLAITGLSYVSSLDFLQVKDIEVSGVSDQEVSAAEGVVEQALGGSVVLLDFFPHSDIFLVSSARIAQSILDAFPSAAAVSVKKKFFSTIIVTIQEKTPAALWCLGVSCANLDQSGAAFEKASATTSLVVFKSGTAPKVGTAPLPSGEFIPLLAFAAALPSQSGIFTSTITVNEDGTDDILVGTSTDLIVDPTKDLSQSLSNLDRLLNNPTSGISIATLSSLQYIDLRFPDKIFYK